MRRRSMNYLIWSTTALVALAALPGGFAQETSGSADHGVARISVINGDVSVRRGEAGEWMAAVVNAPLVSGDRIATGPGSRAEVQFDYGNLIRLAGDSEVNIADLGNNRYQLQVARGTVTYRVLRDSGGQAEIATPNISVRPAERGSYRITVGDGETYVTARSGQAEIYSPRGVETLEAGQTMLVRGAADQPEFQVVAAAAPDEWDAWNDSRDRQLESSNSYRYVSRDIYGAEDLDSYGRWVSTPDYGCVWAPTVAAGWAPYRDGRWVWDDWYGWTWVSYDPWGWAPYHYGRWFYGSVGWCWYPGPVYQRYYWSPALVAFFGWGGGGIGFGFSNIGWVPLGPREPFYPWWGHGYRGYGRGGFFNRNIVNVNVFNSYRNARFNGYTAVSAGDFGRGRWHNRVTVDAAHLRRASLVRGQVPISPGRDTRRFSAQNARYVPRSSGNQRFFSRASNAGPGRNSRGTPSWGGANPGARSFARGGNATRVAGDSGGWRRFGQPQGSGPGGSRSPVMRSPSYGGSRQPGISGWRRFGEAGPSANRGSALQPRFGGSQGFGNAAPSRQSGGGWHRFGEPSGGARSGALGRQPGAGRVGPSNSGGWQRFENSGRTPGNSNRGNSGAGFSQRQDSQRRIPLSPPVVRERSAPGGGSYRGGFGGGSNRGFDRPGSGGFNRSYGGGSDRSFDRPSSGSFGGGSNRSYGGGSNRSFDRPSSGGFGGGSNRSYGGGSNRSFDRPSSGSFGGGSNRGFSSSGGGGFSRGSGGGGFSRSSGGGFSRGSGGGGGRSGGGSHGGGGRRR